MFNNNIPSAILQVGSGEGRACTNLTPTLEDREIVSHRPLAQEEAYQSSSGIVIIVYGKYTTTSEIFKQNHQLAERSLLDKGTVKKRN